MAATTVRGRRCNLLIVELSTVLTLAAVVLGSTVEPPGGECEIRFMNGLFSCFADFKVPFNTYLYVAGNKTGGIPPDNEEQFKEHMCSVEDDVVKCVLDSLHALVDSPHCQNAEGMDTLLTVQVRTIFEEYDNYCAHECRQTLEDEMRQCYSDLKLDPKLFMSTDNDGAILGKTPYAVSDFCEVREKLVTCLGTKTDACPEAPYVLKRLGLDLGTLSAGLKLLCSDQEVYLSSLDCFTSQTRQVEKCQEDHGLALMRLVSRAKTEPNITQEAFVNQFCLARIHFIKCDLTAWASKPEEACNTPALALKRDLHCAQVPQACLDILQGPIKQVCSFDWATANLAADKTLQSGGLRNVGGKEFVLFWAVIVFILLYMDT